MSRNRMNNKGFKSLFRCVFQMTGIFAVATALSFGVISCADDNIAQESGSGGDKDAKVSFNVLDVQQDAVTRSSGVLTRGAVTAGLSDDDLVSQKLEVRNNAGLDVCLIESTVEGVNPTQPNPATRANVLTAIDAYFSTSGYRSEDAAFSTNAGSKWFYKEQTTNSGELTKNVLWDYRVPHARFYSIYPKIENSNNKITLSDENYNGIPYINFEVETDVKDQVDLMTACSGDIKYVRGTIPQVNLAFRHALTAVKFAIGQNLSWGKTIDKVELRNVQYKGRYTLPNDSNVTGTWSDIDNTRTTVSLSGLSVSTSNNPNTIIMGKNNDNFVFYMLPQTLTGNNVKAYFHFTDNTEIEVTLTGSWKAGTTKTYKLSQNTSNWNYILTVESPTSAVAYNATTSGDYKITSYRQVGSERQAVKWKVVGYDANNDGVFDMSEKPAWLTTLSTESGDGGTSAEIGNATVTVDVSNKVEDLNKALQGATPKGSAGNYYNLANQTDGGQKIENTANCYLISAPGYYQIPLVYGNAIKNSNDNKNSYIRSAPIIANSYASYFVSNLKDHNDQNVTSPYINVQNSGNPAIQASIVWADESGLVENLQVIGNGQNSFVRFRVSQASIKNGNAVIAVKDAGGTTMWSWHLWFTSEGVLDTISVTNHLNMTYKFTSGNLGMKYTTWRGTPYLQPRKVRVKVEQELGNGGAKQEAVFTITQGAYSMGQGYGTYYKAGRKDAFPGTNTIPDGTFYHDDDLENVSYGYAIQHPGVFFNKAQYRYYNVWSMNSAIEGRYSGLYENNDSTIKTIYDPNPVGFKMPLGNAFTGFTGRLGQAADISKVDGTWNNNGWTFNIRRAFASDETIYFPALGFRYRDSYGRSLFDVGIRGFYLSANSVFPVNIVLTFVFTRNTMIMRAQAFWGCSVRPVAE